MLEVKQRKKKKMDELLFVIDGEQTESRVLMHLNKKTEELNATNDKYIKALEERDVHKKNIDLCKGIMELIYININSPTSLCKTNESKIGFVNTVITKALGIPSTYHSVIREEEKGKVIPVEVETTTIKEKTGMKRKRRCFKDIHPNVKKTRLNQEEIVNLKEEYECKECKRVLPLTRFFTIQKSRNKIGYYTYHYLTDTCKGCQDEHYKEKGEI